MRLELAAINLEPSKRIWWREEFGGCAPDREPLDSEIWAYKGDPRTVLRTSPLPVENEVYDSSDGDEERSQRHPSPARREPRTEEENESLHQKGRRKIEATRLRLNCRHDIHADQGNGLAGESSYSTSNTVSVSGAGETAVKRPANDWTHVDDSRKSLFRAPTVRPRAKSPKSPMHYIPDRLPPLKIPDFSKKRAVRHKIKIYTAEEDEQARQSGLRKIEASWQRLQLRLYGKPLERSEVSSTESPRSTFQSAHDHAEDAPPNVQINEKKRTSQESAQLLQLTVRKVEANDIEDRFSSAESPLLTSLNDDAARVPSNTQAKEKDTTTEDNKQILEPDRRTLKPVDGEIHHQLRGMSVDPATISSAEIPPLTSQSDSTEKISSNIQKENTIAGEPQRSRQSLYLKIAAMKLRRDCRKGAALYRYGDAAAESPSSTSGLVQFAGTP